MLIPRRHKHIEIIFNNSENQSQLKTRVFKSIYAYLEQQELLERVSSMNYEENTKGCSNTFRIACHDEVIFALKKFASSKTPYAGLILGINKNQDYSCDGF